MTLVSHFVTDVAVVVVVLGFMIFVHELGHFVAAKRFGVRVLVFSLGFGKRLVGFEHGGTDYRISALPLGGYVRMAGEDPSEPSQNDPGEFFAHPRWQRFFIAIMGPAMNVLTAVLLLAGLYKFHFPKPAYEEQPARVGEVEPGSPAARAGFQPDDLIVRLDGLQNPKWEDLDIKVVTAAGEPIPVDVERAGEILHLELNAGPSDAMHVGFSGLSPCVPSLLGDVAPGRPAAQAGLKSGDRVLAVNGHTIACWQDLSTGIQAAQGQPVALTVQRQDKQLTLNVQPLLEQTGKTRRWMIGVALRNDMIVRQLSWAQAFRTSIDDNVRSSMATFDVLGKILQRRMSAKTLSGPIGIAQISGQAYREGLPDLLILVAFISLQLGIFNLLPIPILDGGTILMLGIEGVMRRDLSLKVKERVFQVGMVFLLLLAVFVMYNDLLKTFKPY